MRSRNKLLATASALSLSAMTIAGTTVALNLATVTEAQAAVVRSISVQGNVRVGEATIADFVDYAPGKNYSGADLDEAITQLFRTGLFSDVSVRVSGSTLVVVVDELSTVNQVLFQGNRRIKDDRLSQTVRTRPRGTFDQQTLDADVDAIADAYSSIGRTDVTVSADVVDLGDNRVNVVFRVAEGGKTRISNINFVGNQAFGDRRLAGIISTKETSILRFLSSADVFDEQRIAADEEALRRFYFNRGFADFRVLSSSSSTDPSTGDITITFEVSEGERYTFGNIDVDSTVSGVDSDALTRRVLSRTGDRYSAARVEETLIGMSEELAGNGFPFAEVTPIGNRNFATQTIDISYVVDQGPRAFIERIEIVGNARSRDYVIRREFDVAEGDAFNQLLVRRAQRRLEALDIFERVNITTRPGSSSDRVIVVVEAIDKPTGEFGIGAGYSTGGDDNGVSIDASISDRNFLGRGQLVRVGVGGGADTRTYNFTFREPYFLGYRMSATFSAYQRDSEFDSDEFSIEERGGSVNFGIPLTDRLNANFGYFYDERTYREEGFNDDAPNADGSGDGCGPAGADNPVVGSGCDTPITVIPLLGENFITSSLRYGLTYNSVDDRITPRSGIFATIQQEFAGLGGDAQFIQTTAEGRYYQTLVEDADLIGMVRVTGGNIFSYDGDLAGVDHFKIGTRQLRGFDSNGIGPTDENGNQIGGKNYLTATLEATAPFPFFPREFGLRAGAFLDAGTLWGSDVPGAINDDIEWRTSAGISVIWQSPFAPLRFDYAVPLNKEPTDDERNFHFSVSSAF
ncbi:MAG: outer membrane protein assembly factor BamA [Pseudomonadota bacterium]